MESERQTCRTSEFPIFVVIDVFERIGRVISGYFEVQEKTENPFGLIYLGSEASPGALSHLAGADCFIAIGDNHNRRRLRLLLAGATTLSVNAIDPNAMISKRAWIGEGVVCCAGVRVNTLATVADGVILNTGCIVEHECRIDTCAHVAPGAVLAGAVHVGACAFVGANAVLKQGVRIGENATAGAGAVVLKDLEPGSTVVGNPARTIAVAPK